MSRHACPHCGAQLEVHGTGNVTCPQCQSRFPVLGEVVAQQVLPPPLPEEFFSPPVPANQQFPPIVWPGPLARRRPQRSQRQQWPRSAAVIVGYLWVGTIGVTFLAVFSTTPAEKSILDALSRGLSGLACIAFFESVCFLAVIGVLLGLRRLGD